MYRNDSGRQMLIPHWCRNSKEKHGKNKQNSWENYDHWRSGAQRTKRLKAGRVLIVSDLSPLLLFDVFCCVLVVTGLKPLLSSTTSSTYKVVTTAF